MDNMSQSQANEEVIGTLFIKDVDRIDCATFEPNQGVTGKSWYVDIYVTGQLDSNGFVYDFSHLKKLVKSVLKNTIDHALLIPIQVSRWNTKLLIKVSFGPSSQGRLSGIDSTWTYKCPKGAVYPVRSQDNKRDCRTRVPQGDPPSLAR